MERICKTINHVFLLLLLITTIWSAIVVSDEDKDRSIEELCALQCPFQNKTSEVADGECGNQCYIGQCSRGCEAWRLALKSSCQDVCNGTQDLLPPRELYCVLGCNYAVNRHFQRLRDEVGIAPTPALVADSLTATSLSLEWEGAGPRHNGTLYRLQWRYEEVPSATWQYCRNHTWHTATSQKLENLQPYTKYRFRVAVLVSRHPAATQMVLLSPPSVVIGTLPQGLPASPPSRVRAAAVDSTHVSVTWAPGPFPHGPVLSYVLHLSEQPSATANPRAFSAVKDIAAVPGGTSYSYMFQNVPPERNFTLSVATRNWLGPGPAAMTNVSTPPEPEVLEELEPVLLLGTRNSVIRQNSDMVQEPLTIYTSEHHIQGLALHVRHGWLFLSDSSGVVSRLSLEGPPSPQVILESSSLGFSPRELSVDWLNDLLYVVGEAKQPRAPSKWQVVRCRLDGGGLTVAVAGFHSRPQHLQVDPFNGYMFWVMEGVRGRGGLYRLDLAEVSNGVRHEARPELILEHPALGAFTVDHANFRLLVADHANNTVLAVSLDGKEVSNVRHNTQQPMFDRVISLATANGLFYWTNGAEVLGEAYHSGKDSYYHYVYPQLASRALFSLAILLPAAQPTPVPVNPPSALQAVLGHSSAKLVWQAPHLLGGQGKGAWQNWSYEVQLKDETRGEVVITREVVSSSLSLSVLKPDTQYSLKACAYTSAGRGPWSAEFRGKSFRAPRPGQREATIVWGAQEGVMQSDPTGDRVETLMHADTLQDSSGVLHVTGVAWFEDTLFLATNASRTLWFNLTSRARGHVHGVVSAGSIAVDWLGKKLYWSNPKQQLLTRGSLTGDNQEPVPIITTAKELHIDSLNAFLYWSTGHAVERARLNGQHRHTYYPAQVFSGKQVMGLTLDLERHLVFWIVRSYEGSQLFKAPMALDPSQTKPGAQEVQPGVTNLMHPVVQGPLCYYSDHLLWLQDSNSAVISDMTGSSAAVISGSGLSGLNVVAVIDPTRQLLPSGGQPINVIPESVRLESVRLIGSWDGFNVTWSPVTNVNYGCVFYEVKIWEQQSQQEILLETNQTSIRYPRTLPPYSPLDISVRGFTYWGTSQGVRVPPARLRTPSAPPSAPTSARVFVSFARPSPVGENSEISAQFRWNPPLAPNGEVMSYRVKMCLNGEEDCSEKELPAKKLQYTTENLLSYSEYSFQVWARTEAGEGAGSDVQWAYTTSESPVPRLLVGTRDALTLTDCDRLNGPHDSPVTTVVRSEPLATLAFLATDQRLFWLSHDRTDIFSCMLDGSNHAKVLSLNGTGSSLSLDWVARTLYWSEQGDAGSAIWRLELQTQQATRLLARPGTVSSIQVSPLTSSLYWVEENGQGEGSLMTSQLNGSQPRPFFSTDASCSCLTTSIVGPALSLDALKERLLWSDARHGDIMSTRLDGCHCDIIVNASSQPGLPATALTTDRDLVYWSGGREGRLFSAATIEREGKVTSAVVSSLPLTGVKLLAALGTHLQPFPEPECLVPQPLSSSQLIPRLLSNTSTSLTLRLPSKAPKTTKAQEQDDNCERVLLPSPHYHLYFAQQPCGGQALCTKQALHNCRHLETYESSVELVQLEPFSCYTVLLAMANYYAQLQGVEPALGDPVVFQTQAGAPSEPRNLTVRLLSPWSVRATWLPPLQLRGASVRYEVLWSTGGVQTRQRGEQPVQPGSPLGATLEKLAPAQSYLVWVRAYSGSDPLQFSESEKLKVHTLPEPRDIELLQATPNCLNISWPAEHDLTSNPSIRARVQMSQVTGHVGAVSWHDVKPAFEGSHQYVVRDLSPKSLYQFRLTLKYPGASEPFTWPPDNRFTFETLGDRPSAPGAPHIVHLPRDVYKVSWEPSREHGAPVEMYLLEGRVGAEPQWQARTDDAPPRSSREAPANVSGKTTPLTEDTEWRLFYNGSENYWIISTELVPSVKYSFRACARNAYGVSAWSAASEVFDWSEAALLGETQSLAVVWGTSVSVVALLGFIVVLLVTCICRHRKKEKKALQVALGPTHRPDVELATLREVPRGRGGLPLIQHTNALYTGAASASTATLGAGQDPLLAPTDQEVAALPHIRRDQITLTKFLGSGAFGEVFEGQARQLPGGQETVAVKTLRKGATEQEKGEFLKEAQLMSNFRHAHILQLLGVCLDNDPNFIIMELMEGGDLLSHLRSSRPLASSGALTLLDLVAMCVDVARGCRYLEEMHFVHRDLACRNCLVSYCGSARVVKIGDFGLARDIYKNDYYRKEGEGLLPVRWMAPESLMDGVFTSQSDAWAFGVLVWEILTLGQQPYPARTNLEVLHYVRSGGRLTRPANCPEQLSQLMVKCWSYSPEGRPTFKHCLEVLETLQAEMEADPTAAVSLSHYVGHTSSGMENEGFYSDEYNSSLSGDRPVKTDGASSCEEPFLGGAVTVSLPPEQDSGLDEQTQMPKYLELIYEPSDSERTVVSATDGYEMPRKLPPWSSEIRPRAMSVGCQDIPSKPFKKITSLEKLKSCNNNSSSVPYCNISLSQPLLSGEASSSSGITATSQINRSVLCSGFEKLVLSQPNIG